MWSGVLRDHAWGNWWGVSSAWHKHHERWLLALLFGDVEEQSADGMQDLQYHVDA